MLWVFLIILVAAVVAWRLRAPILAKLLGQSPDRMRRLEQRRRR
jgi:hypothetical protein